MRRMYLLICFGVLAGVMTHAPAPASAADTLGEILEESKWYGIIGTWVDAETMGDRFKSTYTWKLKNRVIEVTTKEQDRESVSLMAVNAKTGEVVHAGADSQGASFLGKWEIDNGDAVLGLTWTDGGGQESALSIRHHREDEDTIIVTVELPDPIQIKLARAR